jgi:hypothetical protein
MIVSCYICFHLVRRCKPALALSLNCAMDTATGAGFSAWMPRRQSDGATMYGISLQMYKKRPTKDHGSPETLFIISFIFHLDKYLHVKKKTCCFISVDYGSTAARGTHLFTEYYHLFINHYFCCFKVMELIIGHQSVNLISWRESSCSSPCSRTVLHIRDERPLLPCFPHDWPHHQELERPLLPCFPHDWPQHQERG